MLPPCWAGPGGRLPWRPALLLLLSPVPVRGRQPTFSTTCVRCSKNRRLRQKRVISERKLTRYFVDHRKVRVVGGQGGGGGYSFNSEPRKIFGGPDGGNGGDGGHVILKADQQMKSLSSVLPFYQGFHGERGGTKNCYGANGAYMYVKVPVGTLIKEDGKVVADLTQHGQERARSGKGPPSGTQDNSSCRIGGLSQCWQIITFESNVQCKASSGCLPVHNPKSPCRHCPLSRLRTSSRGLGIAFLRHIERCRFLLYVVDLSVSQPWIQLQDLKYELEQYKKGLSERPCVVIGNKIDLAQSRINLPLLKEQIGERVIALSALTGDNLEELLLHLRELYDTYVGTEQSRGQSPVKW
ncbi:mitochondrial ribosome-associated GTPase 2 isoform X2 [Falco biarmicus]|uniref:mitochondrial ribosome-associated GTPase 2 isoform X2 n=1 Tax=Falco biarmicus TaxID=345155 RepID=UPI0024BC1B6D|nr:mitochondrial ribosome-associated GTPase 2 isoform X2 [Falco biarmicus]